MFNQIMIDCKLENICNSVLSEVLHPPKILLHDGQVDLICSG